MKTKYLFAVVCGVVLFLGLAQTSRALEYTEILDSKDPKAIEIQVRNAFADAPVMAAVAQCESGFRQFDSAGNVLRGGNGFAIGIFQINETSHLAKAQSMGLDFYTVLGNINYARYLYTQEGTNPWISAFPCWSKAVSAPVAPPVTPPTSVTPATSSPSTLLLDTDLSFGMVSPQVQTLQQLLNQINFVVSSSGPGSPGNETTTFGMLTRAAVRRFQCSQNIICSGDEYTTQYGIVDGRTRQALLTIASSTPASSVVPAGFGLTRDLELGLQGDDVKYLQTFLQNQNFYSGPISGSFDESTQAAVIMLQKKYNITPQYGYVGIKTKGKMKQLMGM